MLFFGILGYGHERTGVLGHTLNSHPLALKYLMSSLMNFYVGERRKTLRECTGVTF